MSFNRPRLVSMLTLFVLIMSAVLYHQWDSQSSMAETIEDIQQDFIRQRQDISTLVNVMDEMRQDKRRAEKKLDSTRTELEQARQEKDSIERVRTARELSLEKTINRLKYEIIKMRRMHLDTLSPLEFRFRSKTRP